MRKASLTLEPSIDLFITDKAENNAPDKLELITTTEFGQQSSMKEKTPSE